jgi:hypothetical protein
MPTSLSAGTIRLRARSTVSNRRTAPRSPQPVEGSHRQHGVASNTAARALETILTLGPRATFILSRLARSENASARFAAVEGFARLPSEASTQELA